MLPTVCPDLLSHVLMKCSVIELRLIVYLLIFYIVNGRPPLRFSVQSYWLQTRRARVRFPALPD
jgi:hypothetical protein